MSRISAHISDEATTRLTQLVAVSGKSQRAVLEEIILKGDVSIYEVKSEEMKRRAQIYDNFNLASLELRRMIKTASEDMNDFVTAYKDWRRHEGQVTVETVSREAVQAIDTIKRVGKYVDGLTAYYGRELS